MPIKKKGSGDLDEAHIYGARENKNLNFCLASATLDKTTRDQFKRLFFSDSTFKSFKIDLKKILMLLLTSKESESRTGGLNILGAICGMSQNFELLTEESVKDNL